MQFFTHDAHGNEIILFMCCHFTSKFLWVACLALEMQQLLKKFAEKIKTLNILAIISADGSAIVSENCIAIASEKCPVQPQLYF